MVHRYFAVGRVSRPAPELCARAHSDSIESEPALASILDRIFFGEPVSTSPENALGCSQHGGIADMMRTAIIAALLATGLSGTTALAVTKNAKMETCKFGADEQKLQGAERKKFIDRCMSNKDDPRGPGPAAGQPKS
jgi:hypothetical protein